MESQTESIILIGAAEVTGGDILSVKEIRGLEKAPTPLGGEVLVVRLLDEKRVLI